LDSEFQISITISIFKVLNDRENMGLWPYRGVDLRRKCLRTMSSKWLLLASLEGDWRTDGQHNNFSRANNDSYLIYLKEIDGRHNNFSRAPFYNYYKPFYVFDLRIINVICSFSSSLNSGSKQPIFTYLGLLKRPRPVDGS
jgi:hypothetical protein